MFLWFYVYHLFSIISEDIWELVESEFNRQKDGAFDTKYILEREFKNVMKNTKKKLQNEKKSRIKQAAEMQILLFYQVLKRQ